MQTAQWIGVVAGIGLITFIVFAFRQGMKVKPDPNNRNFGPSTNDGQVGTDGH
jgi:hypothetical protein